MCMKEKHWRDKIDKTVTFLHPWEARQTLILCGWLCGNNTGQTPVPPPLQSSYSIVSKLSATKNLLVDWRKALKLGNLKLFPKAIHWNCRNHQSSRVKSSLWLTSESIIICEGMHWWLGAQCWKCWYKSLEVLDLFILTKFTVLFFISFVYMLIQIWPC
jgi:hypothetical protein